MENVTEKKDVIESYKKDKKVSTISIFITSLFLAIWINIFLIDWTDIWKNLKASVLNNSYNEVKSDIFIKQNLTNFSILSNKNINNLESLSLSIIYDSNNITINEVTSIHWEVNIISNTPWFSTLILSSDTPNKNIEKLDKIFNIKIEKKNENIENINIINSFFTDTSKEKYLLSTSWITF